MTMSTMSTFVRQAHISIITRHADAELARIQGLLQHRLLVEGRADLERVLGGLIAAVEVADITPPPKTLDLIGHSIPGSNLLQLGDWVIDAASPTVTAFFRELADFNVLPRIGVHTVRLLGCSTACTEAGRNTLLALSQILGMQVCGTSNMTFANHYDAHGFNPEWRFLLVSSTDIREREEAKSDHVRPDPYPRALDVDGLPALPLASASPWPRRLADRDSAREILRLVRRDEGGVMPGLLASPACEIALPSVTPDAYHFAQILFDANFVRVYPDPKLPGVLYPVSEPSALRSIVDALPPAPVAAAAAR
jgi:hypothetical protein